MNTYYTYIYINPANNIPFYVGYGKNNRYLDHLKEAKRNPKPEKSKHKLNTIRKILACNLEPIIKIIDANLSKEQAIGLEKFLISFIGRKDLNCGPLTNMTNGGDGRSDWSISQREQISNTLKTKHKNSEIVAIKGYVSVIDSTGKTSRVSVNDPRYLSGELKYIHYGKISVKNKITGECIKVYPDDVRYLSGEFVGVASGIKRPRSNAVKNKRREMLAKQKFYCECCDKTILGDNNKAQHLKSKIHQKKLNPPQKTLKLWWNNGIIQYRGEHPPLGFVRGRLKK